MFTYRFNFFAFALTACFLWFFMVLRFWEETAIKAQQLDLESLCGLWVTPGTSTRPVILYWHQWIIRNAYT